MKAIVNPAWEAAPFELQWKWASKPPATWRPDPYPKRFNIAPPEAIIDHDSFMNWVMENEIPQFIEIPD